jgi:hypothetical protein
MHTKNTALEKNEKRRNPPPVLFWPVWARGGKSNFVRPKQDKKRDFRPFHDKNHVCVRSFGTSGQIITKFSLLQSPTLADNF